MVAKKSQSKEGDNPPRIANETDHLVQNIRSIQKQYVELIAAYGKINPDDPFATLKWLNRTEPDALPANVAEQRQQAIEKVTHEIEDILLAFDSSLREECRRRSWILHGQWPSYYVELFLKIDVSDRTRTIKIGEQQLGTLYLPTVLTAIAQQLASIAVDQIDIDEFISELTAAYDQITSENHRQPSIWQLYKQFLVMHQRPALWKTGRVSTFRPYDEQKFRAAFTKMLQRDSVTTPDNRELRMFPPIKAEDGMFLYHPVEGRHAFVGRIELVAKNREVK